jgi:hypothetical protein
MSIPYYMIANIGTLVQSKMVQRYPYHLFLAQLYIESEDYRSTIKRMRIEYGTRVILDNGAHEGEIIEPDLYAEVLQDMLCPDLPMTVVLPDLIGFNAIRSRVRGMVFMERFERFPELTFMYVPQGEHQEDIVREFYLAQERLDPNRCILGFGQSYLKWEDQYVRDEDARFQLVRRVVEGGRHPVPYHILGARWRPRRWDWLDGYRNEIKVLGLDTVKPITCALGHTMYPSKPGSGKVDLSSMERADDTRILQEAVRLSTLNGLVYGGSVGVPVDSLPPEVAVTSAGSVTSGSVTYTNQGRTATWRA